MPEVMAFIKKWLETSSKKQKLTAALLAFGLLTTGILLSLGGGSGATSDSSGSTSFYLVSAFVKFMGILLLIVGSSVVFRRWLQASSNGKKARQMRLLETVRLSPKQALHLIVVGDQKLLIGATDQSVALITPVEDGINSSAVEETQTRSGLDFSTLFQSLNIGPTSEDLKVKE